MDLGIALPQWGPYASREAIARVALEAERLGFASVWVQERLLRPTQPRTPYGGVPGLAWPEPYRTVYDPIETLTYVAAITERIKLGTSVLDALFHVPVVLAKRLASLDQLSGGRVIAGLGQGWAEDEFDTANVPMKRRGAGQEEFIAAMRAVWGPNPVRFQGRFYRIPESEIGPKPVQSGGPPILIGSFAPASTERAARIADGINPIAITWEMLGGAVERSHAAAKAAGRDPSTIQVVVRANNQVTAQPLGADRAPFCGTAEQIKEDLARASEMGIGHVFFDLHFAGTPIDEQLRLMERLAA